VVRRIARSARNTQSPSDPERHTGSAQDRGAELIALHRRLLCEDGQALEELTALLLPYLGALLRRTLRPRDADLVNDAAEDALLDYLGNPSIFDPLRGVSLDRFLYVIALRRFWNHLRAARRRSPRAS